MKTKRNSIKRKVQNFSHESDDTVIEPLLQIDKNETANRSAKYLLSKSKTDSLGEKDSSLLYSDNNVEKSSVSKYIGTTGAITTNSNISRTLHNHMNTNVFGSHDVSKVVTTAKSPVLVEISGSRPGIRANQSSSIFTTAKIHADSLTKNMEPIQVTPVPILSTVEGNVVKAGISPDYAQNKSIIPSTSSSILKPTCSQDKVQLSNTQQYDGSHLPRSEIGKSDPYKSSTDHMLKKLSDVLDNRSSVSTTESELKTTNKSYDLKKENVKTSSAAKSIENEIVSKITPLPKPSVSTTTDKKIKTFEEHRADVFKDNLTSLQKNPDLKNIEVDSRITLQNQNASNLKSALVKDDVKKKEDKNISSTSSGKQLQRQKNAICENDKLDDGISNESSKLPNASAMLPTSQSKDNLTQKGASHKSGTEVGEKNLMSLTQVHKPVAGNLSFTPITTKEVKLSDSVPPIQSTNALKIDSKETKISPSSSATSKFTGENSLITNVTTKGQTSKSINTVKSKPSTASLRSDLTIEKKTIMTPSEIKKPVTENLSSISVTTKGVSPKVVDTFQPTSSSVLAQSGSILKEKLVVKPTETCKPVAENSSITTITDKGVSQKSSTTGPTTQSTVSIKSDSLKENKTVVSLNQPSKSAKENSSHITSTSKGVAQKATTATTKSINSSQSVSVKDSKAAESSVQTSKSLKDKSIKESLTPKLSSTSADKSPVTTDTKGLAKNNTLQNLKSVPVSKEKTEVGTSSHVSSDLKSTAASTQHKTDKVQNKSLSEDKSKIPITVLPPSTVPITKTEVKSQPSVVLPTSAKSAVVSKVEPSTASGVKSTSTVSSIPTTNTTSTTKKQQEQTTQQQKITSKTNVLDKHGKI